MISVMGSAGTYDKLTVVINVFHFNSLSFAVQYMCNAQPHLPSNSPKYIVSTLLATTDSS